VKRPPWEVADIIGRAGVRFLDRCGKFLSWPQLKVLRAIERCRTAELGGHRDQCESCGHQAISYNSCLMESNFEMGSVTRQPTMWRPFAHGLGHGNSP
jgi:hypothetical protein